MCQGMVHIFSGDGHGKSSAALGKAIQAASEGDEVVVISFLKGLKKQDLFQRLEPEIKVFRFEKYDENFEDLTQEQQEEEIKNIRNGLNFAKKVLTTEGCDLLVLDEVLGLIDIGIISVEELKIILGFRSASTDVILTGITLDDKTRELADEISEIHTVKH